jgi:dUTP pyrophosphatase
MKVMKLVSTAKLPEKAHAGDLGYDLFSLYDEIIYPDETVLVRTGIAIQFPEGYGAFIKDRSSVATKQKMFTVAGVIDNGYVGEIRVALHNAANDAIRIKAGDKIAQFVLIPTVNFAVEEVSEVVSADARGTGGFGSTGA